MAVLELPPRLSLSSQVRTESRYGTKLSRLAAFDFLPPLGGSLAVARAAMTLPSVVSERLMLAPSLRRAPVAPVELARSEPARSTSEMRETFSVSSLVSTSKRF